MTGDESLTRPCPECQAPVTTCEEPCGIWDCAYHAHLGSDCPSAKGQAYRARNVARKVRHQREAVQRATVVLAKYYGNGPAYSMTPEPEVLDRHTSRQDQLDLLEALRGMVDVFGWE